MKVNDNNCDKGSKEKISNISMNTNKINNNNIDNNEKEVKSPNSSTNTLSKSTTTTNSINTNIHTNSNLNSFGIKSETADIKEMNRAAAILMSFGPKKKINSTVEHFNNNDIDPTSYVYRKSTGEMQSNSLLNPQLKLNSANTQMNSTSSVSSTSSTSINSHHTSEDVNSLLPQSINFHPGQITFLTNVGEMAQRLASQSKAFKDNIGDDETHRHRHMDCEFHRNNNNNNNNNNSNDYYELEEEEGYHYSDNDGCLKCKYEARQQRRESQLSIETLIRAEGERVRLRLVRAPLISNSNNSNTSNNSNSTFSSNSSTMEGGGGGGGGPRLTRHARQSRRTPLTSVTPHINNIIINNNNNNHNNNEGRVGPPLALCTVLASFAPPKASYWEEDRLVEPYLGECCGPTNNNNNNNNNNNATRGSKSEENGATEEGEEEEEEAGDICERENDYHYTNINNNYHINGRKSRRDNIITTKDKWNNNNNNNNINNNSIHNNNDDDMDYPTYARGDNASFDEIEGQLWGRGGRGDNAMRSYGKMLTHHRCRHNAVFHDAFFLDTGNITGGERRKKLIVLHSYRASVISFVDKKVLKKDINNDFYVQHPELEIHEIKLTHVRKIRSDLLNFALEENSPIEVVTVAYANWYFERLVVTGMVGKRNRRLALATCILLAIKFVETGDIHKKINYAKTRFKQDEAFAGVSWQKIQEWEFSAYVGLEFTLMPETGNHVVETHLERLLGQINLTSQEYYSKKFALP